MIERASSATKVAIVSGAPIDQGEKEKLTARVAAFIDKDTFEIEAFEATVRKLLGLS